MTTADEFVEMLAGLPDSVPEQEQIGLELRGHVAERVADTARRRPSAARRPGRPRGVVPERRAARERDVPATVRGEADRRGHRRRRRRAPRNRRDEAPSPSRLARRRPS
jgi:hypothetical protein